jgi:hypothetical protein
MQMISIGKRDIRAGRLSSYAEKFFASGKVLSAREVRC